MRRRTGRGGWFEPEFLEPRRLLSAGALDASFGSAGRAVADFGVGASAKAAVVQDDGKTVVVGTSDDRRFAVARYNVDGSLDATFGPTRNGTALASFGHDTFAEAVALQDDGRIVVSGGADSDVDVARFNPDGTLDDTFDGDGKKNLGSFGYNDYRPVGTAIVIPPPRAPGGPQQIIIGGTVNSGSLLEANDDDFFVARLNADGSLDISFGESNGHHIVGIGGEDRLSAMALDLSGTAATNPHYGAIVCAGTKVALNGSTSEFAVVRLDPNGDVDDSFDGDGKRSVTPAAGVKSAGAGLVIQPDGKYVVGGTAGTDFAMLRFLPDGALDTTFGASNTGWVQTDMGGVEKATDLTASYDGGLILGGTVTTGLVGEPTTTRDAFAAYTADGHADTRFVTNGRWTLNFNSGGRFARGPGRRFVFAGGARMQVLRLLDVGANLVGLSVIDPLAYEQFQETATLAVTRSERLPVPTTVFLNLSGGAVAPGRLNADYTGIPRPALGESSYRVDIPADATVVFVTITPVQDTRAEGNEIASFTVVPTDSYEVGWQPTVSVTIVDDDAPPPGPVAVYVRGSTWAGVDLNPDVTTFGEYLESAGLGDDAFGYRVDDKPAADVLPWVNLDQVVVRYASPPVLAGSPMGSTITLDGVRSDYNVTRIDQIDPATFLLQLDRPLGGSPATPQTNGDRVHLALPGGGGFFHYDLRVLQGDVDKSGGVLANDYSDVKRRFFRSTASPGSGATAYTPYDDVDGNGVILASDFSEVKKRFFQSLPTAAAAPAAPPAGARRLRPAPPDLLA